MFDADTNTEIGRTPEHVDEAKGENNLPTVLALCGSHETESKAYKTRQGTVAMQRMKADVSCQLSALSCQPRELASQPLKARLPEWPW